MDIPRHLMMSYSLSRPAGTMRRSARCEEVDCAAYQRGWRTTCDTSTSLGRRQADFITRLSGRKFTMERAVSLVIFTFPPGQQCFTEHVVLDDVEPLYLVRDGWRRVSRQHAHAEDWVDDFATHQQRIADHVQKG